MITVHNASLHEYLHAFPTPRCQMAARAILAGNTAGRLWAAESPGESPGLLLWDQGNNVFYLSGDLKVEGVQQALRRLVEETILPEALAKGKLHFSAHALPVGSAAVAAGIFAGWLGGTYRKRFYSYPFDQAPPVQLRALARLVAIDGGLLGQDGLENLGEVRAEIEWMWPSVEHFVEHGFGVAAQIDERLACWCTAEYVSTQACGIGIATHPPDQKQGLATAVTAAFIAESLQRGLTPHWECAVQNHASVRVAEKIGFVLIEEDEVYYGQLTA